MEEKIKVSVVIPVYNVESYLLQCLESVSNQTLKEIQVICVDNCSTDQSFAMLQDYAKKDSRFQVIQHPENLGLPASRNTGASMAKGDFIYFLDSDDYISTETLARTVAVAEEKELDVLFFEGIPFYESEELKDLIQYKDSYFQYHNALEEVSTGKELFACFMEHNIMHGEVWRQLISRHYYQKKQLEFANGLSIADDTLFNFQNLLKANRVFCLHEPYYYYRIRQNSVVTSKRKYKDVEALLRCYSAVLLTFSQAKIPPAQWHLYKVFFRRMRQQARFVYREATGEEPTKLEETMVNMERILLSEPLESLPTWSEFVNQKEKYSALCFFGAGKEGQKALEGFRSQGFPLPVAICDNGKHLHGTEIDGIPVLSWEEAQERYPNLTVLITNKLYYDSIFQQVSHSVGEENILKLSI